MALSSMLAIITSSSMLAWKWYTKGGSNKGSEGNKGPKDSWLLWFAAAVTGGAVIPSTTSSPLCGPAYI